MPTPVVKHRIVAKAASYSIESRKDRSGTIFTNRGASGAITFTLPPASRCNGWSYKFFTVAAQSIVVAARTVNTLLVYNNITTADSLASPATTAGIAMEFWCDGINWFGHGTTNIAGGTTAVNYTIATA